LSHVNEVFFEDEDNFFEI